MAEFDYRKLKSCGVDVRIASSVFISAPDLVSIGDHVAIDSFCHITTALDVGDYVHIAPFCSIIGGRQSQCTIKDFAGVATGSRLVCASDDFLGSGLAGPRIPAPYRAKVHYGPIVLEKHALLGTNVVVHPGVRIGEGAAVGSCSLVTQSLEPWHVYVGIPAKPRGPRSSERILALEAELRAHIPR